MNHIIVIKNDARTVKQPTVIPLGFFPEVKQDTAAHSFPLSYNYLIILLVVCLCSHTATKAEPPKFS